MSFRQKLKNMVGHEEFLKTNIWKALIAEFIGTGFLVLVGCGSTTPWVPESSDSEQSKPPPEPSVVQIGLAFGLIVATMVQCVAHISGGHINPAITIGCLFNGRCSLIRATLFFIVQLLGACVGAGVLKSVTPSHLNSSIGTTALGSNMNAGQGLTVEFCITFVLVFTVLAVTDSNRRDLQGSGPLAIGYSIVACHLWAVRFTGSSMNTARSFGPALVANKWENHWIYWVGPLFGGLVAGLIYKVIFENPPSEEGPPKPLEVESENAAAVIKQTEEKASLEEETP